MIALIAVIAAVMASAAGIATVGAPTIFNAVSTNFQRALCVVTGERCAALATEPCPVLRTAEDHTLRATLAILKLDNGRNLLIERRSDGSYLLSLVEGRGIGLGIQGAAGDSAGEVASSLGLRIGRTYRVNSAAEAQALATKLRRPGLPTLDTIFDGVRDLAGLADADPAVESYDLVGRQGLDALGKLGIGGWMTAEAAASHEHRVGVRIAAHRREATVFVDTTQRGKVAFEAFAEAGLTIRRKKRSNNAPDGKNTDAGANPVDLTKRGDDLADRPESNAPGGKAKIKIKNPSPIVEEARAVTKAHVAVKLGPGGVLGVELVGSFTHGGKTHELRARLDPDAPGLSEALEALRHDPTSEHALRALGQAAADGSALDRRTFAYRAADSRHGKLVGRGAGLGLTLDGLRETSELIEQQSRPIGGVWAKRLDC